MPGDEGVTYTFKDLFDKLDIRLGEGFSKIDHRLDKIDERVNQKADNSRVAGLEERMAQHEQRVDERFKPLEFANAGLSAVSRYKWAFWGLAGVVLTSLATIVWLAVGSFGGH